MKNYTYRTYNKNYEFYFHSIDFDGFDFIIVGGGSGGSVVADRLSEWPQFKVLVVEAGGNPPLESMVM